MNQLEPVLLPLVVREESCLLDLVSERGELPPLCPLLKCLSWGPVGEEEQAGCPQQGWGEVMAIFPLGNERFSMSGRDPARKLKAILKRLFCPWPSRFNVDRAGFAPWLCFSSENFLIFPISHLQTYLGLYLFSSSSPYNEDVVFLLLSWLFFPFRLGCRFISLSLKIQLHSILSALPARRGALLCQILY